MKRFNRTSRLLAALLAILLTALLCASCGASGGKALLTMNHEGTRASFSVNYYELMLSRMKGVMVDEGYNATEASFWDILDKHNGTDLQTLAQYYGDLILENCKTFTVTLWLFENYGLSLTDEQIKKVDDRMKNLLEDYAEGSKTRFNAILSEFGVNYKMLRELYLLEEKVTAVQEHLYGANASKLGVAVKDEFLKNNYVRFKQIHLPSFNYVYETDKPNGDVIYYVEGTKSNAIAYDTANGFEGKKADNTPITDANGDTIYYATADYAQQENPRIAYDTKNGVPAYVLDNKGVAKTVNKTEAELKELSTHANELLAELQDCTVEEFEAKMKTENRPVLGKTEYEEGYYVQKNVDFAAVSNETAYLSDIVSALDAMEVGGIAKVDSGNGYHIVMKYEPLSRAYDSEANSVWFSQFNAALVESLFLEECRTYYGYITLDEKVLATARDIKAIGANPVF